MKTTPVSILDDHELVRRGLIDLLDVANDMTVVGADGALFAADLAGASGYLLKDRIGSSLSRTSGTSRGAAPSSLAP